MSAPELIGQLTLGACVPTAGSAVGVANASISATLPTLLAKAAGYARALVQLTVSPPSLEARVAALANAIATLLATPPNGSLTVGAVASAFAAVQAEIGKIQAQFGAIAAIDVLLGTPGVWAYKYQGTPQQYGPDFSAEIGGGLPDSSPDAPIYAVTFIASDAGAIEAMKVMFAA